MYALFVLDASDVALSIHNAQLFHSGAAAIYVNRGAAAGGANPIALVDGLIVEGWSLGASGWGAVTAGTNSTVRLGFNRHLVPIPGGVLETSGNVAIDN